MVDLKLSKSGIESFARCPRYWRYTYLDGYETTQTSDALGRGLAFHKGLESYWAGRGVQESISEASGILAEDSGDVRLVWNALESYFDLYGSPDSRVLAIEQPWEIGSYKGVWDAIIEYRGRTLVVESKTTTSYIHDSGNGENAWYFNKLDLDIQTGLYVWAAQKQGYEVDSVLYDVTRFPKMQQGKVGRKVVDESLNEFEDRVRYEVFNNQYKYHKRVLHKPNVAEVMNQVGGWALLVEDAMARELFPKNHNSCFMWGRQCEFKPVCTGSTTLENTRLYKIRTRQ